MVVNILDCVTFKPRARIMLELGEQLIKNESVAILELIKNSYDAFARNVIVELYDLDNLENGCIIIEDDGVGMTKDILINNWMEPATSFKKKIVDDLEQRIEYKGMKRAPLGEKGIGRFGVHKLGNKVRLITKAQDNQEIFLEIDWNEFNNDGYLEDIKIEVHERNPKVFVGEKTGTRIEIKGIKHIWQKREFRDVYKSILALNSPFEADNSFKVSIESNHSNWMEKMKNFEELKDKALFTADILIKGDSIVNYKYEFTPWSILSKVKPRVKEVNERQPIYDVETLKKKKLSDRITINLNEFEIGEINIKLMIFDLDSSLLNLGFQNDKSLIREFLKNNSGIAIYRDNIRLNEYGDKGNDWLGLGLRRINNPAKTISSNIVIGAVYIDRLNSKDLIEKTSREGFIENAAYKCFEKAVLYAISLVEEDRMLDKAELRKYYSGSFKEPVIDSVKKLVNVINEKEKDYKLKAEITSALKNIEKEYLEISAIYLKSSSLGMNLSIVIHEVDKILKELGRTVEIEGATGHIKSLVSDLSMRISSYSEMIKNTKIQQVTLSQLIKVTIDVLKYRIKAHHLTVYNEIEYKNILSTVKCPASLIRSVIMNIIDNSIYWLDKFDVKDKKLYFDIYNEIDGFTGLIIADNGKGFTIPKDKLTVPFVSKKDDGMGLGLHLANQIMQTIGGNIYFPDNDDLELPVEFKEGAVTVLLFKED